MGKELTKKILLLCLFVITTGFILYTGFHSARAASKNINSKQLDKTITIYLAGDSTVSTYPKSLSPRSGWGQELAKMFDGVVVINNQATRGRSSKSFIEEGRLNRILHDIKTGDYLFIQFGHNDEKIWDSKRYTKPSSTYKSYLKQYIDGARVKGAIPVLITPVQRMCFAEDGTALESHGQYPLAMKELGREEHVPVIDLAAKSRELFQQLGPRNTKKMFLWLKAKEYPNYPNGASDSTHFQKYGARKIARLVINGINELSLPIKEHVLLEYQ